MVGKYKDEISERQFWETHNSTDYVDRSKAKRQISELEVLDHGHLAASAGGPA